MLLKFKTVLFETASIRANEDCKSDELNEISVISLFIEICIFEMILVKLFDITISSIIDLSITVFTEIDELNAFPFLKTYS